MRNVLTVFIASPSDLAAERKRAFEAVAETNEVLKEIDWSIDLLGWEDTLPGYGRPQSLINRDVERCDLFIGLLWHRWGTPPAQNSAFSSGFEEEFSIARGRRERNPSPEIWMFFKTVESGRITDPGAQLQSVIAFRSSLSAGKAVLFKGFDDVDSWEKMLRKYLYRHVLRIAGLQRGVPEGPSERVAPPTAEAEPWGSRSTANQVAAFAQFLAPALKTGDLSRIIEAAKDIREVTFYAVRGMLLSTALVAASRTSRTPLPTHEVNTLYLYRDRLQATDEEFFVIFGTILADDSDVKPGWYWFKDHRVDTLIQHLAAIALFDDDATARARSFEILRRAQVNIFENVRDQRLGHVLREMSSVLRDVAWSYLVDIATVGDINALRESATGTWLEPRMDWLRAWIEVGRNLDDFLPKMPDPQLVSDPMKLSILASISQLANASLEALRSMPLLDLRKAAQKELRSRGAPVSEGEGALATRLEGVTLASLLGEMTASPCSDTTETDQETYNRLSRENSTSLKNSLDWYNVDGPASYRLLVERGEISREFVRKDLSDKFQRIKDESDERNERTDGAEIAATYRHGFDKLREFITEQFAVGALAALAAEPTCEDVAVAREFLNKDRFRPAALRIIASKGTAMDVNGLIDIARSTYGEERQLALDGVQRLSPDKLESARTLMGLEGRDMQRTALSLVSSLRDEDALSFFEQLLSHDDGSLRVAAVGHLHKRVDRTRLGDILRKYTNQESYFYNVVVWLDRLIYAPAPILSYYETELDRKIEALHH